MLLWDLVFPPESLGSVDDIVVIKTTRRSTPSDRLHRSAVVRIASLEKSFRAARGNDGKGSFFTDSLLLLKNESEYRRPRERAKSPIASSQPLGGDNPLHIESAENIDHVDVENGHDLDPGFCQLRYVGAFGDIVAEEDVRFDLQGGFGSRFPKVFAKTGVLHHSQRTGGSFGG